MYDRRILILMLEKVQESNDVFCHAVPIALREYVAALEKANASNEIGSPKVVDNTCVEFETTNGCVIRAIAGKETLKR